MNVLYHHRTASRDGQAVHIDEFVGALRRRGHRVTVVSPAGGAEERERSRGKMGGFAGGLSAVRRLLPDALVPLAARVYDVACARRLVAQGRRLEADVLYERHALYQKAGGKAARRLGIPWLLEVNAPLAHEEAALGRLKDAARAQRHETAKWRSADAVLVVTAVLRDMLVEFGADPERIHVVPNAVDPHRFLAPRDPQAKRRFGVEGRFVLGFLGFPRPWHGLDLVVAALADARGGALADAVLLVGGEGPSVEPLRRLAKEAGLEGRVVAAGPIDRADVPAFLDAFDVALQPRATAYASPLKLFEYLARGLPVVAPRQANIREVVEHGRDAWLFEPDDASDLKRALEELGADEALRARLGRAARRRIEEGGFTWDRNAERVEQLCRRLGVGGVRTDREPVPPRP